MRGSSDPDPDPDPPGDPVALTSGVAVTGLSGTRQEDLTFILTCLTENGADSGLSGTGDPDLSLHITRYLPVALCVSLRRGWKDELCTIDSPAEGRYYIRVKGFRDFSGATLIATAGDPPPALSPASQTVNGNVGIAITATTAFTATNFTGGVD